MKLHSSTHVVEKSGNFEENQFSIEASAKAFMILSDGLYSNKILAVIRELSTNAYDSHVDAGVADRPFEVHLPTRLEPYFHVRDYGTSMTHDQCMTLYTTYFRSTRNDSNDAVGCLGLGSKAPFAYADSFTVEAFKDGEKRVYAAHRDSNGSPTFCLMDTVPTDEENGIKVSLPVEKNDCDRFAKEATKTYQYFKVRPTLNADLMYNTERSLLTDKNGKWDFTASRNENFVIMGQIAYPIEEESVGDHYDDNDKVANFLWHTSGLRLRLNIGDVDITPSREALSYTSETKKNIRNVIESVVKDIKGSVEDAIKQQPTLYLARKKYVEIEQQCHSVKQAMESLNKAIKWNDQDIFDEMVGNKVKVSSLNLTHLHKSGYRSKSETNKDPEFVPFRRDTRFVIDDLPRGGMTRIRNALKEEYSNRGYTSQGYDVYIYKLRQDLIGGTEKPYYYDETKDNNKLLDKLGGAKPENVVFTSDMPKPERSHNRSSSVYSAEVKCFKWNGNGGQFQFEKVSVKDQNMVYIPAIKKKNRWGDDRSDCKLSNFLSVSDKALSIYLNLLCKYYGVNVYGKTICLMTPSQIKQRKLEDRSNWEGPEFIVDYLKALVKDSAEEIAGIRHAHRCSDRHLHDVILGTNTDNKAKQIVLEFQEYYDRITKNQDDLDMVWKLGRELDMSHLWNEPEGFDKDAKYFNPLRKEMQKYPLLDGINTNKVSELDMSAYIDMVENSNKVLTNV
jgi:hypothetical protein